MCGLKLKVLSYDKLIARTQKAFLLEGFIDGNKLNMKKFFKNKTSGIIIISITSIVLIYLLISLYFSNHFFFHTVINGVSLSLSKKEEAVNIIRSYLKDYELQLLERNGETEFISGHEIGLQIREKNSLRNIDNRQNSFLWISSLFTQHHYYVTDLYTYKEDLLNDTMNQLMCFNKEMIAPQNVSFTYSNGTYEVMKEVYGNKIIKDKLINEIKLNILKGKTRLDLDKKHCYKNPKYYLSSDKTFQTKNLLNKYIAARVIYKFGNENEVLEGNLIHQFLHIDENLDVIINKNAVMRYVKGLSRKYDTVGVSRNFKTSTGKIVEVKGGLFGWKINQEEETKALLENIKRGKVIEKEPIYIQKAFSRNEDEIGNTYIEINITRQYLWFYKEGKIIVQGAVVTGNPNRGNSTVTGTYMIIYKQNSATLKGVGYEVEVNYWMPFYGNMGVHDANWRNSFGGEIYKRRGTHGCVNAPLYLAKTIFNNIEVGIPVIIYEENN